MNNELIIKNGYVFDPLNDVDGESMDLCIREGRIVEKVGSGARTIDASGMTIMPGGVDIHSHIAGSKVNTARVLRPEDHVKDIEKKTRVARSGVGYTIPSTFTTGYRYAKMGYTTVIEPATPPLKTRHTHDELRDIPIVDKGCFPLMGNNWFVLEYIKDGDLEGCKAYVAWMLKATKGYAIKMVNPGGIVAWGWGKNIEDLDEAIPFFEITPREIVRSLCKISIDLGLPHPIHVHANRIGTPGNYVVTLETMECVKDMAKEKRPIIHMTHVQFNGMTGNSWINVGSGAPEISDYVNKNKHVSIDLGQIIFTDTTTMTADGPFQYKLHKLTGNKWVNADVETESGAGIVPIQYKRKSYANSIQWGIGLELALLVEDPWRIFLTTDHPNGGPFTEYPSIISWLMSKKARTRVLSKTNKNAQRRLDLKGIDREYTFNEVVIVTRAATAKSLGLRDKGHLGVGADADIAIYDLNPTTVNPSRNYRRVKRALQRSAYTIKDGRIVSKDGDIMESMLGRTYWVDAPVDRNLMEDMVKSIEKRFTDHYTIQMKNYFIKEDDISNPRRIQAGGRSSP